LDVPLLELPGDTRDDLEAAVNGHMLGKVAMMGRYQRHQARAAS
jgi:hypothetical protein